MTMQTTLPLEIGGHQLPLCCEPWCFFAVCELCGTVSACHRNNLWFGGRGWHDRVACCDEAACEPRRMR